LDPDLFALNDLDRDPANIFPDQRVFLDRLAERGIDRAHLVVPGSVVTIEGRDCRVTQPDAAATTEPFRDKAAYLDRYQRDWSAWLEQERAGWRDLGVDLVAEVAT